MAQLFEPTSIGPIRVKNRIAKTATSETRASDAGEITDSYLEWYEPLAKGGVGLIITGNVYAGREGQSTPKQGGIDRDDRESGGARGDFRTRRPAACRRSGPLGGMSPVPSPEAGPAPPSASRGSG